MVHVLKSLAIVGYHCQSHLREPPLISNIFAIIIDFVLVGLKPIVICAITFSLYQSGCWTSYISSCLRRTIAPCSIGINW